MSLCKWKLFSFSLTVRGHHEKRKGLILKGINREGRVGWGEISPLPGWSSETLEMAREQVLQLINGVKVERIYPSVSFGLSSLFFQLSSSLEVISLPVSAFLSGSADAIVKRAEEAKENGFHSAKLKIGHLDKKVAQSLIRELKKDFSLRVDLNRSFTCREALDFFSPFTPEDFDYIEEPISDVENLSAFPYPVALDESLREGRVVSPLHLKALIIKPSLHDGWQQLSQKEQIVLSSAHESGVGIFHIGSLIASCGLPKNPLGIDTYHLLENDILTSRLSFSDGMVHLPAHLSVDEERLCELS